MIKCPSVPKGLCVGLKEKEERINKSWSEAGLILLAKGQKGHSLGDLFIQIIF